MICKTSRYFQSMPWIVVGFSLCFRVIVAPFVTDTWWRCTRRPPRVTSWLDSWVISTARQTSAVRSQRLSIWPTWLICMNTQLKGKTRFTLAVIFFWDLIFYCRPILQWYTSLFVARLLLYWLLFFVNRSCLRWHTLISYCTFLINLPSLVMTCDNNSIQI